MLKIICMKMTMKLAEKKFFKTLLFLLFALIQFPSCSNSDDIDDFEEGASRILKEIYRNDGCWFKFEYDDSQRLIKVIEKRVELTESTNITEYKYENNTIKMSRYYSDSPTDVYVTGVYTLDDEGYLIESKIKHTSWLIGTTATVYTYDNGYIKKSYSSGNNVNHSREYKWENENIVTVNENNYKSNKKYTSSFKYDNTANLLKINATPHYYLHEGDLDLPIISSKGLASSNYVISQKNKYNRTNSYAYTFDKKGYPTTCKIIDDNKTYTYTYRYY